jgi:D-3-phosphoglycerate dehydrogenase
VGESTVQTLIVDLLEWIGPDPRSYADVQDVWRTSCPKLPVWEDAVDAGFLDSWFESGRGRLVAVSPSGIALLRNHARDQAFVEIKFTGKPTA